MNMFWRRIIVACILSGWIVLGLTACAMPWPVPKAAPTLENGQGVPRFSPDPTIILTSTAVPTPVIKAPSPTARATQNLPPQPGPGPNSVPTSPAISGETTSIFGASFYPRIEPGAGLVQAAAAGLQWTRAEILWQTVEPAENDRDWARNREVEEELLQAAQMGMKAVVILGGTPAWAVKPGFLCGVIRDDLVAQFASFAAEAVARYSQPPYNVQYWEIFNEPDAANLLGCWGNPNEPYYGGKTYGKMLSQVYPAMKAVNPDAQVLVGGLLMDCDPVNPPNDPNQPGKKKDCAPGGFMEGVLQGGAVDAFDGIAFHSYDYYGGTGMYSNFNWWSDRTINGSSTIPKAAYLRSLLVKYNISNRYLINTEFAIFCGKANQPDCDKFLDSVETTKVYYVVQFAATAAAEGYRAAIWYASHGGRNNALFNLDLTSKPVLNAYQFANQMLKKATFSRMFADDPAFKIYEFQKNGQVLWVAWTLDGKEHTLKLPRQPAAFYRMLSNGQAALEPAAQTVTLTLEPAFLVFP